MSKRRAARELAFQLLFEKTFRDEPIEELIGLAQQSRDIEPDKYVLELIGGVEKRCDELDEIIGKHSRARSLPRLSKVVLATLRLALYEILYMDAIDASVSINEAVETAKLYAGEDEAGFVNGVLGAYIRSTAQEDA